MRLDRDCERAETGQEDDAAAYKLARWLLRDESAARDVVQERYLRAFRFVDGLRGGEARPWLLGIVRNTRFTWLQSLRKYGYMLPFDEERDSEGGEGMAPADGDGICMWRAAQCARDDASSRREHA